MLISIIIPFYNEAEGLPRLRAELLPVLDGLARRGPLEVVFVDDGSTDGGLAALQSALAAGPLPGVTFLYYQHKHNRGLGAALRTGFAAASGEAIVTTDSDGTYRFETIPVLLACLKPGVDLVTASPYHPQGGVAGVPRYRLVLSQGSSLIYRLLVDWRIHTYTCLYRAYRRPVLVTTPFTSDGFLAGTELMVKAMLKGFRVAEYPAVLHARQVGVSKAKIMRTIRAHLGFQWAVLLHRLGLKRLILSAEQIPQG
jgi:dolichol-phosphate mannosyltransferase